MKNYLGVHGLKEILAKKKGITLKDAEEQVREVLDVMETALLDDKVEGLQFMDFLTIEKVYRKPRKGRNPKQPETVIEIPGRVNLKAKAGRRFSEELNK